jgi:hypothetical protein
LTSITFRAKTSAGNLDPSTIGGAKGMSSAQSNLRTDEELRAILNETGRWAVNGQQGQVLCLAASLQRAIERASDYALSDAVVVGVSRLPGDNIVIPPAQIDRLREIAGSRVLAHEPG